MKKGKLLLELWQAKANKNLLFSKTSPSRVAKPLTLLLGAYLGSLLGTSSRLTLHLAVRMRAALSPEGYNLIKTFPLFYALFHFCSRGRPGVGKNQQGPDNSQ